MITGVLWRNKNTGNTCYFDADNTDVIKRKHANNKSRNDDDNLSKTRCTVTSNYVNKYYFANYISILHGSKVMERTLSIWLTATMTFATPKARMSSPNRYHKSTNDALTLTKNSLDTDMNHKTDVFASFTLPSISINNRNTSAVILWETQKHKEPNKKRGDRS